MIDDIRAYGRDLLTQEGFAVDIPADAARELAEMTAHPLTPSSKFSTDVSIRDLRDLPWSSIDNVETRDVDQLEHAERVAGGTLVRVAIADVDAYVKQGSALDARAAQNTVSVYAGDVLLPMLPEELSAGLTSLLAGEDRLAIVAEFVVDEEGATHDEVVYSAWVRNNVQLDYESISAWIDGGKSLPERARPLEEQLSMQHEAAVRLRKQRVLRGALDFERVETRPVVRDGRVVDVQVTQRGAARDLIEDFMTGANAVIAGFLEKNNVSWIRRMVGEPERWPRIVEIAEKLGTTLPAEPDRHALGAFLRDRRAKDPSHFAAISVSVLKLLGSGAYVIEHRQEELGAHFALGVEDYTHFTAPNRRYADVVTQRIVKAVLAHARCPYDDAALDAIAKQCTEMEDKARAVERRVEKRASVQLMSRHIGDEADAVITAVAKGRTFATLRSPHVDGRIVAGEEGLRAGQHVRVRVSAVDVERDHIGLEII
jgi:exoribonuclease-2